jgi:peptide/nickel transport system substrate-binding protein
LRISNVIFLGLSASRAINAWKFRCMKRREFLSGAASLLAAPTIARAQESKVLRFIPQTDLTVLDPMLTYAYATRTHAYLVFDTLYGQDSSFQSSPQMLDGHLQEDDGKLWRLTLRPGLKWHDGVPVLARDCVASIRRWAKVDPFGQSLMLATDSLLAGDDRTIVFRFKRRFPLLPQALGKLPTMAPVMMPERLALTDPSTPISEMIGSGPFRFLPDERVSGSRVAYARFADYVPRSGGVPQWTAGPKIARVDRVEWTTIPDATTAAAALQSGEQDWWEYATSDLLPVLKNQPNVRTSVQDTGGRMCYLRMNEMQPPFDNSAIRRAVLGAVNQSNFMMSVAGDDRSMWHAPVGFFPPGTPMASDEGLDNFPQGTPDYAKVRAELAAAGYRGEPVVLLGVTEPLFSQTLGEVAADMLRKAGMNVDYQISDYGSSIKRRSSREPVSKGGWSCVMTAASGVDMLDPAVHGMLRGNGYEAMYGWPNAPALEKLRDAWLDAPDLATQKQFARAIQRQAFVDVPYIPTGQFLLSTAYSARVSGIVEGFTVFWNLQKT